MRASAADVSCELVSQAGFHGSVSQTVSAGESTTLSGHVPIELPTAQSDRIDCLDVAETDGVDAMMVLSAFPVGSIVTQ
jgi:hypothetical protein